MDVSDLLAPVSSYVREKMEINLGVCNGSLLIRIDSLEPRAVEGILCTDPLARVQSQHVVHEAEGSRGHAVL